MKDTIHFLYVPFTGLGLYGGFRGNKWLKNRIQIFKQFVIPSLQAQTSKNFILWISWRPEEKHNALVKELMAYLETVEEFRTIHSFSGVCFWDDKYPDKVAHERLISTLHSTMAEVIDWTGPAVHILMTIQPSDDCYHKGFVEQVQKKFESDPTIQAVGYRKGYISQYRTGEVAEYNPLTNPPFFTIKFPRPVFIDPLKHAEYTGPYKSHEYVGEKLKFEVLQGRGFLVGTHGENISTIYNHPFRGEIVGREVLAEFGLENVLPLEISIGFRKWILRKLPHRVQRKLRYVLGEKFYHRIHQTLRA